MNTVTVIFKHSDNKFTFPCQTYDEALDLYHKKCKEFGEHSAFVEGNYVITLTNRWNEITYQLELNSILNKENK